MAALDSEGTLKMIVSIGNICLFEQEIQRSAGLTGICRQMI